jgi:hypothetical protein
MKKEIVIPEATVVVETKFYATTASNESMYRNQSSVLDTYDEVMQWIAQELTTSTNIRTYEIHAVHGRFSLDD